MLGWLKAALNVAAGLFGILRKNAKPTLSDLLPEVVAKILPAVKTAIAYQGLDSQEKLDSWLLTLDEGTGSDAGAIDFLKNLPPDKEEELFDHLIEIARIYGYSILKLPGYTV